MTYKNLIFIICIMGWSATTVAAESNVDTLATIPWISVCISGAISLWGGMIATLQKLSDITLKKKLLKVEVLKDLLASIAAGFVAYSLGMWGEWNVWLLATALLIAGYGGSKILDALLNLTIKKIENADVTTDYSGKI